MQYETPRSRVITLRTATRVSIELFGVETRKWAFERSAAPSGDPQRGVRREPPAKRRDEMFAGSACLRSASAT